MSWTDRLRRRRLAYQRLFLNQDGQVGPDARIVLDDLRRFCYVNQSTLKVSPITRLVDPYASMHAEGRRETWVRIQTFLNMDDRQIANLEEEDR